ncbi:pyrimidine reductase family protein [Rhodococcus rhodnii]|uniref:pyrimidine reductase family protein n=1 Tax=Rhodococcus rhodnii TaxID=38312 RepID=UPI0035310A00
MSSVHSLLHATCITPTDGSEPVDATPDLDALYAYPDTAAPWVRVNFVASIDGARTLGGRSAGLGTPADHRVFSALRGLADVVVVGAGTARDENYGGVRIDDATRAARLARGQAAVPPVCVVSASGRIDPAGRLTTDTEVAPIVVVGSDADEDAVAALRAAGADVVRTRSRSVPSADLLGLLAERGLVRVLCEGGPTLFGALLADDAVDELCLTTSPMLVAGGAGRIAESTADAVRAMRPEAVLADDDGTLLVRWVRAR